MERTYLYVPPEEKAEVQVLGAQWDAESKRWYIESHQPAATFSKWLSVTSDGAEEEFTITSDQAFVAEATVPCHQCGSAIEVICIHCESGTVSGEPLTRFSVSDVWAMDEELAQQIRSWPNYRRVSGPEGEAGTFANHCPHCVAVQDDLYLHSEPGEPFFDISAAEPGTIRLTPLAGTIGLSGDEHFAVE